MARPLRIAATRVAPRVATVAKVSVFVASAIGPIDWDVWWTNEDYRVYTNLQVFATGLAAYAGKPPTNQALMAGMDAVFWFVMANATWPPPMGAGPDPKAEAAAEAAHEIALLVYEPNAVAAVLPAMVAKWRKRLGGQQLFGDVGVFGAA